MTEVATGMVIAMTVAVDTAPFPTILHLPPMSAIYLMSLFRVTFKKCLKT